MNNQITNFVLSIFCSMALVACGGGGGGGNSSFSSGNVSSSNSSSSSAQAIAKIDQVPLLFFAASVELFIDDAPVANPLTGGSGAGEISFASSNVDVATVDQTSGDVTIVGDGSATISANKSADDIHNAATATYTLTVSKYDQEALVFEQTNVQAVISGPTTNNPVSGGSGSGVTNYAIENSTIASIDVSTGTVSPLSLGTTTVTATKTGDGLYNSASTSYILNVVEVLSNLEILVGQTETLISWDAQAGVVGVARTTNPNCDIDNILRCANGRLTTVTSSVQTPVVDTYIKTTTPAYLTFQHETYQSNPLSTRVVLAPFPKRRGGQMVSFKGKLWMIGGIDDQTNSSSNDATRYNDIWSSEDGISWTLEISNAAFAGRSRHQVLEYRGDLYLFGGEQAHGTEGQTWSKSDVWKSSDGVLWQEMSSWAFDSGGSAKFIVFNDKIWGIGGSAWSENAGIWSTTNGTDWTLENAAAPFGPREWHAVYVVNNLLMVLGGYGAGYNEIKNDVWSSPDGITWKEEAKNTSFAPRVQMKVKSLNGVMWLMGGSTDFTLHKTGYSSSDGIRWTLATTQLPSVGQFDEVALHKNALWIYDGFENGLIWKSNNGTQWGVPIDSSTSWNLRP